MVAIGAPWHGFQHWIWDNQINWAAIVTAVSAIVAVGGVGLVWLSIRDAAKNRNAQTAADFSRRWDEKDLLETRQMVRQYATVNDLFDSFFALEADKTKDDYLKLLREPNYFEDLAILEEQGAVSYDFIRKSLGFLVASRWRYWEPVAEEYWIRNGMDNFPHFRALATST